LIIITALKQHRLGRFPSRCGDRIEIDELRIVRMGISIQLSAAMNLHQGLHTLGI
jgi:hypothetical protein